MTQSTKEWSSGVFECHKDPLPCVYAFCCLPCYACPISKSLGEHALLPLLDLFSPAALSVIGIPMFVAPVTLSLRTAMRKKYGLEGNLKNDIFLTCFCNMCVWCQMGRELKHRENVSVSPFSVTTQPGARNK